MRIYKPFATLALIVVTGCDDPLAQTPQDVAAADKNVDLIECALGEGSLFRPDCTAERVDNDPPELIVRRPDGGFQRFYYAPGASGLVTADGADEAANSLQGDMLEVRVAGSRYRFPARLTGTDNGRE